jgi:chemotaxis protein MotB
MSRKKKRGGGDHGGGGGGHDAAGGMRWLLTYSDMITLLLALFIFLYSISEINASKMNAFSDAMADLFGIGRIPQSSTSGSGGSGLLPEANSIVRLHRQVSSEFKKLIDEDLVDVAETEEGLKVRLKDKILFGIGSADITPPAQDLLRKLSLNLVHVSNKIRVEGHTDNLPMSKNSRYPSNWELSGARAASVVRFFIERCHLNPMRFAIAGYAEYHPIQSNLPIMGRSANRRVEIIILRTKADSLTMNRNHDFPEETSAETDTELH